MPAENNIFPWMAYYGHYKFFEDRMRRHHIVTGISSEMPGVYNLDLRSGKTLRVFICECYSYGEAEYHETVEKLGAVNAVVMNSMWCGYTKAAKELCKDGEVGLFKVSEFMGALNKEKFWLYVPPEA